MGSDITVRIASAHARTTQQQVAEQLLTAVLKSQAEVGKSIAAMLMEQADLLKNLTYNGAGEPGLPSVGTNVDLSV
jgi:hypothetical protein